MLDDLSHLHDDFRLYVLLSELADATDDPRVEKYCEKAHLLYGELTDEEKQYVSRDSLFTLQNLYKQHCGADW